MTLNMNALLLPKSIPGSGFCLPNPHVRLKRFIDIESALSGPAMRRIQKQVNFRSFLRIEFKRKPALIHFKL